MTLGYRPGPNALCAYERTARPAGNALINSKVKIQKSKIALQVRESRVIPSCSELPDN
jgi:hypothetical protein